MAEDRTCEILRDRNGWWLSFDDRYGKGHRILMVATNEMEAQCEAQGAGFTIMNVWYGDKQIKTIRIPKPR